jgi:hypothetical protein
MSDPPLDQSAKATLSQLIDYFNKGIREAEIFCGLARSSKLQMKQCLGLDLLLHSATQIKHEVVRRGEEGNANLFLGFECVIGAIRSELL